MQLYIWWLCCLCCMDCQAVTYGSMQGVCWEGVWSVLGGALVPISCSAHQRSTSGLCIHCCASPTPTLVVRFLNQPLLCVT
jgi:hypothetical protein